MTTPIVDFTPTPNLPLVVFAANEGDWGDALVVQYTNFDVVENTFNIVVYEKTIPAGSTSSVLQFLEQWTVSREYKKDGFGKQLFLEDRINGVSDYIYVVNNGGVGSTVMPDYAVTGEVLGTGDGTLTSFSGNLVQADNLLIGRSIQAGTLSVDLNGDGTPDLFDAGNGELVGTAGSGTVNYSTGAFTITVNTAVANAQDITAIYQYSTSIQLAGGANGETPSVSVYLNALSALENPRIYESRYLVEPAIPNISETDQVALQKEMVRIAELRGDCVAVLNIPSDKTTVSDILHWRKNVQAINSSYACIYGPDVVIRDPYNDVNLTMQPSGFVTSAFAKTHSEEGIHADPMGVDTGTLPVVKLAKNFTDAEYALLYKEGINLIMNYPDTGPVLYGSRTCQFQASLLRNLNVRFLMNDIRKDATTFLRQFIGRQNTPIQRQKVETALTTYLQNKQGIVDFRVTCSDNNNPTSIVDQNLMICDIFIYPEVGIHFIHLRSTIADGVTFQELIANSGTV